ncbi:hypothetical protein KSP40_PGU008679 [Platanthera guangdongensis]|uniref:Uncharacterized protein n=1 Tax=Platanthera guangdongensis TaxID=2320717 RepID=A0ABR2LIE7_9ASPA
METETAIRLQSTDLPLLLPYNGSVAGFRLFFRNRFLADPGEYGISGKRHFRMKSRRIDRRNKRGSE